MALKSNIFLITIEFLLVAYVLQDLYASVFLDRNNVVVFPEDNDLNATNEDPKVVGIGNFAVDEYNRFTSSDLRFQSVVKAMYADSSYMMVVQVTDGGISESKQYAAVVHVQADQMSLVAFEEYTESAM